MRGTLPRAGLGIRLEPSRCHYTYGTLKCRNGDTIIPRRRSSLGTSLRSLLHPLSAAPSPAAHVLALISGTIKLRSGGLSTLLGDRCAALYFGPLTPSRLRPLRCRCDATRFTAQSRGRQSLLLSSCPGPIPVRPFRPSGPSGPNRYRTTSARPMFLSTRSALRSIHPVRLTRKSNAVNAASRPDRRGRGQAEQHMHVAARHSCCRGQRTPQVRQSPCGQSTAQQA